MTLATEQPAAPRLTAWIVDPIGYSGLIYYDLSLATALGSQDVDVTLVTCDTRIGGLKGRVPELLVFRGTARGSRPVRGARHAVSLVRLAALALRRRPSVMHWQYLAVVPLDALVISLLHRAGIRQVYTAHEVEPWRAGRIVGRTMQFLYRSVDAVVVHHEADVAEVRQTAGRRSLPVAVIAHGSFELFARPEQTASDARDVLGLPLEAPIALFFGSLRDGKGLDDLIEAWPAVIARVPDALLLICGKPSRQVTRDWVVSAIQHAEIAGSVRARLEQVDTATANACYRASDVVVLPYREITTSGVLRYAWSSARPVIATSVGEHRNLVDPGVGVLVPPHDPAALALAIAAMLSDRTAAREMGLAALAKARRDLSWSVAASDTRSLYRSITAQAD